MRVKFVQVNIYKGKYLDALVDFFKRENPDFISMQEVTTYGFNLCRDKSIKLSEFLKDKLGMHAEYHGDLRLKDDKKSVFGSAVFSRFEIVNRNVVTLKKFRPVTVVELDGESGEIREQIDKHLLDCEVNVNGRKIHALSWHGAWTAPPKDTAETLRQARIVYAYIKKLTDPFILGGDLNNIRGSKTIDMFSDIAVNLMADSEVSMTTNSAIHKIAPRGYLIDYIFTSKDIRLIKLTVPQITVSDHLPIVAELEI